ncbi:hypothetical protein, partial [Pantoea sp. UBA7232]|uniref:hypothetical protein n=1 Tax=Pantoea sp. UBA7232 TaxID=1947045 RepID=UPI0025944F2E
MPSPDGPGWRFPPLLVFSLFLTFFMAEGFVKKLQTTPQHFLKKQNEKFTGGEEGRYPQRRAQ